MKIYDTKGFPNPARVRIALAEKGATDSVEFVAVAVMGGEHSTEAFKAKSPDAVFPCFELADGTPKERAQVSMMNLRAENGLLNAVGTYCHNATPGLGPDLESYQCAEWGNKHMKVASQTMAYLDRVLADNECLAGVKFSIADITAFAGLAFADFAKVEIPATLSNLNAWRAKVAARPSIVA